MYLRMVILDFYLKFCLIKDYPSSTHAKFSEKWGLKVLVFRKILQIHWMDYSLLGKFFYKFTQNNLNELISKNN